MNTELNLLAEAAEAFDAFDKAETKLFGIKQQFIELGEKQVQLTKEILDGYTEGENWSVKKYYPNLNKYDFLQVNLEVLPKVIIGFYWHGRCGDNEECFGEFELSPHIINGDNAAFKQSLEDEITMKIMKEQRALEEQKQKEIAELKAKLSKLEKL